MAMKLVEFSTYHGDSAEKIARVRFVLAGERDGERREWIDVHLAVDELTSRGGHVLRRRAVIAAIERLEALRRELDDIKPAAQPG